MKRTIETLTIIIIIIGISVSLPIIGINKKVTDNGIIDEYKGVIFNTLDTTSEEYDKIIKETNKYIKKSSGFDTQVNTNIKIEEGTFYDDADEVINSNSLKNMYSIIVDEAESKVSVMGRRLNINGGIISLYTDANGCINVQYSYIDEDGEVKIVTGKDISKVIKGDSDEVTIVKGTPEIDNSKYKKEKDVIERISMVLYDILLNNNSIENNCIDSSAAERLHSIASKDNNILLITMCMEKQNKDTIFIQVEHNDVLYDIICKLNKEYIVDIDILEV